MQITKDSDQFKYCKENQVCTPMLFQQRQKSTMRVYMCLLALFLFSRSSDKVTEEERIYIWDTDSL